MLGVSTVYLRPWQSLGSGGRLASKRSEMGRVNLGAQSFNAEDALFIEELQQWQQAGWVEQTNPAQVHGPFQQLIVAIPAPQAAVLLHDCAPELASIIGSKLIISGCFSQKLNCTCFTVSHHWNTLNSTVIAQRTETK